jgi:translation elongation factor EF-Ts
MTARLQSIFPTPVLSNKFDSSFVKKEKDFIQSHADKVIESNFNNISKDKYILEYMEMGRIRKFIEENINYYLKIYFPMMI